MKLLLFSFCMAAGLSVWAQNSESFNLSDLNSRNDSAIAAMKKYIENRNLKSGVVHLSQDNMPCVIPNTKLSTPMPNAWRSDSLNNQTPGAIPNPARPKTRWQFIPIKRNAFPFDKKN